VADSRVFKNDGLHAAKVGEWSGRGPAEFVAASGPGTASLAIGRGGP
jgi:hypothetical protein